MNACPGPGQQRECLPWTCVLSFTRHVSPDSGMACEAPVLVPCAVRLLVAHVREQQCGRRLQLAPRTSALSPRTPWWPYLGHCSWRVAPGLAPACREF